MLLHENSSLGFVVVIRGATQEKFEASSILSLPLYSATLGHAHKGRVRSGFPFKSKCAANISSGGTPFSTHCPRAVM